MMRIAMRARERMQGGVGILGEIDGDMVEMWSGIDEA